MSTEDNIQAAVAVATALAPIIGATSPQGAAIVALAPIALNFLDAAIKLQSAGVLNSQQLASLFASVGTGIQSTHDAWMQMDAADAAK